MADKSGEKIVVVMPAYNAEKTLRKTYNDIPKDLVDEVILVDDGSRDGTVKEAKRLGIKVHVHTQNRGYGGNQKTCYTLALSEGADVVVMIHPDYQYDPKMAGKLVEPILKGEADVMLGSRIRSREEAIVGGMPLYKYIGNRLLTTAENAVLGQNLSEYHTGYRAYTREVLEKLPFLNFSDNFVFDQEILIAAIGKKFRIGEVAVPVKYFPEASSIDFKRCVRYGIETLIVLVRFFIDKRMNSDRDK